MPLAPLVKKQLIVTGERRSEKPKKRIKLTRSGGRSLFHRGKVRKSGSSVSRKTALFTWCALSVGVSVSYAKIFKRRPSCTTFSRSSASIRTSLTLRRTETNWRRPMSFVWKKSTTTKLKSCWAQMWYLWRKSSFGNEWQMTTPRAKMTVCSTHLSSTSRSRIPSIWMLSLVKEPLRTLLSSTQKSFSSLIKIQRNYSSILTNRTLMMLFTWRLLTLKRAINLTFPNSCQLKKKISRSKVNWRSRCSWFLTSANNNKASSNSGPSTTESMLWSLESLLSQNSTKLRNQLGQSGLVRN